MRKRRDTYIKGRLKSLKYAFNGIALLFKEEPNAVIHSILAVVALLMGFLLNISTSEWIAISIVIGLVLAMEAFNSAIEQLANFASGEKYSTTIKKTKDLSAGAVLITAIVALFVGMIIFLPKLLTLLF